MADVRCPMCSKPNPADAQACQHCGARLKPLVAPSQPGSPSPATPPPSDSGDSSDWLGSFRSGDEDAFRSDAGEAFDAGGEGDWFSRLGQEDASAPAASEKPGWLAAPSEKGDPNIPDWMEDLGVSADAGQAQDTDWGQFSPAEESAQASTDADALKGWLAGLSDTEGAPPTQTAGTSEDSLPDWLSGLETDTQSQAETFQPFAQQSFDEPQAAQEPLPDWLAGGDSSSAPVTLTEGGDAETPAEAGELPDWLTAPGGLPEPVLPPETPSSPESDVPDWLAGIEAPDLGAASRETEGVEDAETLPSWLSESAPEEAPLADFGGFETLGAETPASETQEAPDWLSQFGETDGTGEDLAPVTPESQTTLSPKPFQTGSLSSDDFLAENTPDWLSNLGGLEEMSSDEAAPAQSRGSGTDWLSGLGDLGADAAEEAGQEVGATPTNAFAAGDMSWGAEAQEKEEPGVFGLEDMDATPDWLSNVSAPEINPEETPPASAPVEQAEDATLAELPTWLEAMRPVESAAPSAAFRDETDGRVESAGPLSGLRGVLQAEPDVANFRKPPVYTNKLQVTETHQAHIALLEELVASEGKPKPVQVFVPIRAQAALRWIITLLLSAAAIFGLLGGSQVVNLLSSELPVEIKNLRGSIEALPPNAPVLVVVDYEAGSSAEMIYPGRMVLQNLEQRQAFIGFVSSSLHGPMLAELLLEEVQASTQVTYTNYTVLGYIPGGAGGLLSFAHSPGQVVSTFTRQDWLLDIVLESALDGPGWESAPLKNVHRLSDFALIVVMSDNADTARIWIEQVGPALDEDTPLTMVLSAQAEPMVRPYFLAGIHGAAPTQLSGYVAGLAGAAAYQSKLLPDTVLKEWDALAMASGIALILIVLGGLVNFGLAVSSRPKGKK